MADGVIYYKKEDAESIIRAFATLAEEAGLSDESRRLLQNLDGPLDSYNQDDALGVIDASFFQELNPSSYAWRLWETLTFIYDADHPLTSEDVVSDSDLRHLVQNFDIDPASLLLNIPGYFIEHPEDFETASTVVYSAKPADVPQAISGFSPNAKEVLNNSPPPSYPPSTIFIDVSNIVDGSAYFYEEQCTFVGWDDMPPVLDVLFAYLNSQNNFDWHNPQPYVLTLTEWEMAVVQHGAEYNLDAHNSWHTLLDIISAESTCLESLIPGDLVDLSPDDYVLTYQGVDAYVEAPQDFYIPVSQIESVIPATCDDKTDFPADIQSVGVQASVIVRGNHRIDLTPKRWWLPSQMLYVDILDGATFSVNSQIQSNELEFDPQTPTVYLHNVFLNSHLLASALDIEMKALQVSYDASGDNGKLYLVLDRHDYDDLEQSAVWNFIEKTLGDAGSWLADKVGAYNTLIKVDVTSLVETLLGKEAAASLLNDDGTLKANITVNDLMAALQARLALPAEEPQEGFWTDLQHDVVTQVEEEGLDLLPSITSTVALYDVNATYFPEGDPSCTPPSNTEGFHITSLTLNNGSIHAAGTLPAAFLVDGVFPVTLEGFYIDNQGNRRDFEITKDKPLLAKVIVNADKKQAYITITGEDIPLPLQVALGSTHGTVDPLVVDVPGIETGSIDLTGIDRLAHHGNTLNLETSVEWPTFDLTDLASNNWVAQIHYALNVLFKEKPESNNPASFLAVSTAGDVMMDNSFTAQGSGDLAVAAHIAADQEQTVDVHDGSYAFYMDDSQNWGGTVHAVTEARQGKAGLHLGSTVAVYDDDQTLHLLPRLDAVSSLGIASHPFHFGITEGEMVFSPNGPLTAAELSFERPLGFYTQNLDLPIYDNQKQILGEAHLGATHGLIKGKWSVGGARLADIVNTDLYGNGGLTLYQGLGIDVEAGPQAHFVAYSGTGLSLEIGGINLADGMPGLLFNGSIGAGIHALGRFDQFSWNDVSFESRFYDLNVRLETPGVRARAYARPITLDGLVALNDFHGPSPDEAHAEEIESLTAEINSALGKDGEEVLAAQDFDVNDAAKLAASVERFMLTLEKGGIDWKGEFPTRIIHDTEYLIVPLNPDKPKGVKMLIPLMHYVDQGHRILGEKYKLSTFDIELTRPIYIEVLGGIKIPLNGLKLATRAQPFTRREKRGEVVDLVYSTGDVLTVKFYDDALTRLSPDALLRTSERIMHYQPHSYEILRLNGHQVTPDHPRATELMAQSKPVSAKIIPFVSTFVVSWGDNNINWARVEIFQSDLENLSDEEKQKKIRDIILGNDPTRFRVLSLNVERSQLEEVEEESRVTPEMKAFQKALAARVPLSLTFVPELERVFMKVDGRNLTVDVADSHLYASGLFGLRDALKEEVAKGNYTVVAYEDEQGNSLTGDALTGGAQQHVKEALLSGNFCGIKLEDRNAYQRGRHVLVAKVGILRLNVLGLLDFVGFFQTSGPLDEFNKTFYKKLKEEHGIDIPRNTVPTKLEELVVFVKALVDLFTAEEPSLVSKESMPDGKIEPKNDDEKARQSFFVGILGVIVDSLAVHLDDAVINSAKLESEMVVGLGDAGAVHIYPDGPFTLTGGANIHVRGDESTRGFISLAGRSSEALPRFEVDLHNPNTMHFTVEDMHNLWVAADFINGMDKVPQISFTVDDAQVSGPLEFAFADDRSNEEDAHFRAEAGSFVRGNIRYDFTPVYDDEGNFVEHRHHTYINFDGESVNLENGRLYFTASAKQNESPNRLAGFFNAGEKFKIHDGTMDFSFNVHVPQEGEVLDPEATLITDTVMDIDLPFTQQNGHLVLSLGGQNRNLNLKDMDVAGGHIRVHTKPYYREPDHVLLGNFPEFLYEFDDINAALDIPSDRRIEALNLHLDPAVTNVALTGDGTIRLFGPEGGITATPGGTPLSVTLTGPVVVPISKAGVEGFLKIDELVVNISDLQFEMAPDPLNPNNIIPTLKNFVGSIAGQGSVQATYQNTMPNGNTAGLVIPPQPWRLANQETTVSFSNMNDWSSLAAENDGFGLSIGPKGHLLFNLQLGHTTLENGEVTIDNMDLSTTLSPYFKSLVEGLLQSTARVGLHLEGAKVDVLSLLQGLGTVGSSQPDKP
ncbi:hypothetical protein K1X76_06835 [bacterium]|nr:hypothetical protein [bacterium]